VPIANVILRDDGTIKAECLDLGKHRGCLDRQKLKELKSLSDALMPAMMAGNSNSQWGSRQPEACGESRSLHGPSPRA